MREAPTGTLPLDHPEPFAATLRGDALSWNGRHRPASGTRLRRPVSCIKLAEALNDELTRLEATACLRDLIEEIRLVPDNGKLEVNQSDGRICEGAQMQT